MRYLRSLLLLSVIVSGLVGCFVSSSSPNADAGDGDVAGDGDADTGDGDGDTGGGDGDKTSGDAGSTSTGDGDGDGRTKECMADDECDDGLPCTVDACSAGACTNALIAGTCPEGALCALDGTCSPREICGADADCIDDDPCTQDETCDAATATCNRGLLDRDGDGHVPVNCGGADSNDGNPEIYPGAPEICDGNDNDGNGVVDDAARSDAFCQGEGFASCGEGRCNPCTVEDVELLVGDDPQVQYWHSALAQCRGYVDQRRCFEGLRTVISNACFSCFSAYAETVWDCAPLGCECDNAAGLEELRACANGYPWECGPIE